MMKYLVSELAQRSGVSARTLRYYDKIGLLTPLHVNAAGYREYGPVEVARLDEILMLRGFGLSLGEIADVLERPEEFAATITAQMHRLVTERGRLQEQIEAMQKTLQARKGELMMTDADRFAQMKKQQVLDNEMQYGAEARRRYGDDAVDAGNQKWQHLTTEQYAELTAAEQEVLAGLKTLLAMANVDLTGETAQQIFNDHRRWLKVAAPFYNAEYHQQLALMYVEDDRFTAYYDDRAGQGAAALLSAIIQRYAK